MPIMKHIFVNLCCSTAAALALSACTPVAEGSKKVSENAKANYEALKVQAKEMFTYRPPQPPRSKPLPPTYCYRVMQDITCHATPQPGAEARLVAYQGSVEVDGGKNEAVNTPPADAMAMAVPTAPVLISSKSDYEPLPVPLHYVNNPGSADAPLAARIPAPGSAGAGAIDLKPQTIGEGPKVSGTAN